MSGQATETRDARRSSRHAPQSPVAVVDAMSGDMLGFVIDLSAGGMKLRAVEPLVDDALYQVQFDLTLGELRHASIEAGMQVVSQRPGDKGSIVGLRFIHLQGAQAQQLGAWLRLME
ncbi:MAG: PilZ domain-containing protein [Pseudomonadota bacterium]|nr:PilZ domain-containing protein [Pseudomonadota bacterium]